MDRRLARFHVLFVIRRVWAAEAEPPNRSFHNADLRRQASSILSAATLHEFDPETERALKHSSIPFRPYAEPAQIVQIRLMFSHNDCNANIRLLVLLVGRMNGRGQHLAQRADEDVPQTAAGLFPRIVASFVAVVSAPGALLIHNRCAALTLLVRFPLHHCLQSIANSFPTADPTPAIESLVDGLPRREPARELPPLQQIGCGGNGHDEAAQFAGISPPPPKRAGH